MIQVHVRYVMICAAQRLRKTQMIHLSVGLLGTIAPLLEDLEGHNVFGVFVLALSDSAEEAVKHEVLKQVLTQTAGQHISGLQL